MALDHHGAGQGQVAVDIAHGQVETVLMAFVGFVALEWKASIPAWLWMVPRRVRPAGKSCTS